MAKKKVTVKRPRKSKWNAENILNDPKSPLAKADLRNVLSSPMAWDALNKDEREAVLSLFPDDQHILAAGTDDAQPDFASLMNDDSFRHDCAAYVENVKQGRHDVEWLEQAWSAHQRRKVGDYDEHLERKFVEEWGVELPDGMKPDRGVSGAPSVEKSTTPWEGALRSSPVGARSSVESSLAAEGSSPVADEIVVQMAIRRETNGEDKKEATDDKKEDIMEKTECSEDTQEEHKSPSGETTEEDETMEGSQKCEDREAKAADEIMEGSQEHEGGEVAQKLPDKAQGDASKTEVDKEA